MYFIVTFIQNAVVSISYSILANFLSALILAILGPAMYAFFYWKNRREKLDFFGISSSKIDTKIYVSRIEIKPNGTEGHIPIDRGFIGPSISKLEYEAGLLIQEELESKTIALLPKKFRDWLGKNSVTLKSLNIPIEITPEDKQEGNIKDYLNTHLFILGSSMYNLLSKYYLEEYLPKKSDSYGFYEKYQDKERIIGIRFENKYLADIPFKGRSYGREIGFIHRFKDEDTGMTVFLCVGHGSSATYGSIKYLINKWPELHIKYKDQAEFIIALAFEGQEANVINSDFVVDPEVVWPLKKDLKNINKARSRHESN